jgi:nickel-dependent lactate racemase
MIEAAKKAGVDFILNVVTHSKNDIAFCSAGDVQAAWVEAVKFCENMNTIQVKESADIVIASCGGYPKDINMYQAQKALDSAVLAVKSGGTIILAAECSEGLGEEKFKLWIEDSKSPQNIVNRFHTKFELGGHKAFAICRILDQAQILLVSKLPSETVNNLFMTPVETLDEAIKIAKTKHGQHASIIIMPEAPKVAVKIEQ